jgi:polynucleotide 5'-kinase involved in rRNA processing
VLVDRIIAERRLPMAAQAQAPPRTLALQREEELEPILRLVDGRSGLEIHRLPVSSRVIRRSQAARRAFREERFREYFGRASRRDLEWKGLRFIRLWLNTGRRLAREELTALGVSLQTLPMYAEAAGEEGLVFVRGSFNRAALIRSATRSKSRTSLSSTWSSCAEPFWAYTTRTANSWHWLSFWISTSNRRNSGF